MGKDIEFKAEHGTLLRGWHYLPDQRTTHDGGYASEQSFFAYSVGRRAQCSRVTNAAR